MNTHGTHVLQKTLLCMKEENTDYIVGPVLENFSKLACDQHGLCVIKRIIAKTQRANIEGSILNILENDALSLV